MNLVIESFKTDTTTGALTEIKYLDGIQVDDSGNATAKYSSKFTNDIEITAVTYSGDNISTLKVVNPKTGSEVTLEPAGG